jgi:hypothetical protein
MEGQSTTGCSTAIICFSDDGTNERKKLKGRSTAVLESTTDTGSDRHPGGGGSLIPVSVFQPIFLPSSSHFALACRVLVFLLSSCSLGMMYYDSMAPMKYDVTSLSVSLPSILPLERDDANTSFTLYDTNVVQEKHEMNDAMRLSRQSCHWIANMTNPTNQSCYDRLIRHMKWSLNQTRHQYLSSLSTSLPPYHYVNRRFVMLGDSTVYRLYAYSHLRTLLTEKAIREYQTQRDKYYTKCSSSSSSQSSSLSTSATAVTSSLKCRRIVADRCSRMEQIRLEPLANTSQHQRVVPDFQRAEGPMSYGIDHPACTDCRGCDTRI